MSARSDLEWSVPLYLDDIGDLLVLVLYQLIDFSVFLLNDPLVLVTFFHRHFSHLVYHGICLLENI